MLTEKTVYQQIYNTDQTITIHKFNLILKDGVEISRSLPHTHTIAPGDSYFDEDIETQKMCGILWTKKVIESYQAAQNDSANQ